MYIPKQFLVESSDAFSFIDQNSFGQLISDVNGRLFSTHIPFLLSEDRSTLYAHIALQIAQHTEIDGQEVLVVFQGEHAYISPSWYSSSGVPTWNYQAAHVYGKAKVFSSKDKLKWLVDSLTQKYEAAFSEPWQPDYNEKMLQAIVGVEISIAEVQFKNKLSQNKSSEDQGNVISELRSLGEINLADAMEKNKEA